MKILLFAYSFGSNLDTFINNEIKYLSQKHQVKCVCYNYINEFKIDNVEEIKTNNNSIFYKLKWQLYKSDVYLTLKDKLFSKKIITLINDFKPDIIHCHFAYEALTLLDNFKNKNNIPIIIHFHGYGASKCLKRKSYIKKMKNYLAKPNIFPIYVSDFMKNNLENAGISMQKGIKLYYGINLNDFIPNPNHQKDTFFTFLQVSTLVEKKGIAFTLMAFKKFLANKKDKSKFQLILTGDNPKPLENYKKLVKELNIDKNVTFFGRANHQQVIDLMNNANVFIHHSITAENGDQEGIPNSIMEAMTMKLPVISTIHAGIPELVKDGVNGYLVKEKDVDTYAQRMEDILSWTLKDENREVIKQKFNYEMHNQILENFYIKLIDKRQ